MKKKTYFKVVITTVLVLLLIFVTTFIFDLTKSYTNNPYTEVDILGLDKIAEEKFTAIQKYSDYEEFEAIQGDIILKKRDKTFEVIKDNIKIKYTFYEEKNETHILEKRVMYKNTKELIKGILVNSDINVFIIFVCILILPTIIVIFCCQILSKILGKLKEQKNKKTKKTEE